MSVKSATSRSSATRRGLRNLPVQRCSVFEATFDWRKQAKPQNEMLLTALLVAVTFVVPILVEGTALTTPISPNERLCFYVDVDKAGEKIGVSFSCYQIKHLHL